MQALAPQEFSQKACFLHGRLGYHWCHEKASHVSNYGVFTLLHEWVDRRQTHRLEKLQSYTSSDEIGITHTGVFLIVASALY